MSDNHVDKVASDLRADGYAVSIPQPGLLPSKISLVAEKGDEKLAVMVMPLPTRAGAEKVGPEMEELADTVEAAGYTIQIFFLPANTDLPEPISIDTLSARLQEIRTLARSTSPSLLIVPAWALLEAATRRRSHTATKPLAPATVVKTLLSLGSISDKDATRFSRILLARNAAAHGFQHPPLDTSDIEFILAAAARIADESPPV